MKNLTIPLTTIAIVGLIFSCQKDGKEKVQSAPTEMSFAEILGLKRNATQEEIWAKAIKLRNEGYKEYTGKEYVENPIKVDAEETTLVNRANTDLSLNGNCGVVWDQTDGNACGGFWSNTCQSHAWASLMTYYTKKHVNNSWWNRSPWYIARRLVDRGYVTDNTFWQLRRGAEICTTDGSLPRFTHPRVDDNDVNGCADATYSLNNARLPANKNLPRAINLKDVEAVYPDATGSNGKKIQKLIVNYSRPVVLTIALDDNIITLDGNHNWTGANINIFKGYHVVLVVGYDGGSGLYKIKNSWGVNATGHDQGYFYATKDQINKFYIDAMTYAL